MNEVREIMRKMLVGEATEFHVPAFESAFPGALSGATQIKGSTLYTGTIIEGGKREFRFTRKGNQVYVALFADEALRPASAE